MCSSKRRISALASSVSPRTRCSDRSGRGSSSTARPSGHGRPRGDVARLADARPDPPADPRPRPALSAGSGADPSRGRCGNEPSPERRTRGSAWTVSTSACASCTARPKPSRRRLPAGAWTGPARRSWPPRRRSTSSGATWRCWPFAPPSCSPTRRPRHPNSRRRSPRHRCRWRSPAERPPTRSPASPPVRPWRTGRSPVWTTAAAAPWGTRTFPARPTWPSARSPRERRARPS